MPSFLPYLSSEVIDLIDRERIAFVQWPLIRFYVREWEWDIDWLGNHSDVDFYRFTDDCLEDVRLLWVDLRFLVWEISIKRS